MGSINEKCPHCSVSIFRLRDAAEVIEDVHGKWQTIAGICPACHRAIIEMLFLPNDRTKIGGGEPFSYLVYPKGAARPLAPEVPKEFSKDFREACLVLVDSPKASAALSRRCLQHLINKQEGIVTGVLATEIDQLMAKSTLPAWIAKQIDEVRHFGNLAAHATHDKVTGQLIDVEPGAADAMLDILESLFEHYFVNPALAAKRQAVTQQKLADAGKGKLKQPPP